MDMLQMNDNTIEYVSDMRDFLDLVDKYMGFDARRWLEEYIDDSEEAWKYNAELEKDVEGMHEYHKDVMRSIRKHSENLAHLISEKELNRREISNTAGAIGVITWREINR